MVVGCIRSTLRIFSVPIGLLRFRYGAIRPTKHRVRESPITGNGSVFVLE